MVDAATTTELVQLIALCLDAELKEKNLTPTAETEKLMLEATTFIFHNLVRANILTIEESMQILDDNKVWAIIHGFAALNKVDVALSTMSIYAKKWKAEMVKSN